MKYSILTTAILLLVSCKQSKNDSSKRINIESVKIDSIKYIYDSLFEVDASTKYKMYCEALQTFSTAPYYLVVTVKNLNNGQMKELCTESNFLNGAIHLENGSFSNPDIDCKKYKERYFEFKKDSSLRNISFNLYSEQELNAYSNSIDIDKIIQEVKNGTMNSKNFSDIKEQVMFAHLMFNKGIMMTRGCYIRNICSLEYFKSKK